MANFHLLCLHHQTPSLYRWSGLASSLAQCPFRSHFLSSSLSDFPCHVLLGLVSLLDLVWKCNLLLSQYQGSPHRICLLSSVQIFSEGQTNPKERFCSLKRMQCLVRTLSSLMTRSYFSVKSTAGGGVSTSMGSDITLEISTDEQAGLLEHPDSYRSAISTPHSRQAPPLSSPSTFGNPVQLTKLDQKLQSCNTTPN